VGNATAVKAGNAVVLVLRGFFVLEVSTGASGYNPRPSSKFLQLPFSLPEHLKRTNFWSLNKVPYCSEQRAYTVEEYAYCSRHIETNLIYSWNPILSPLILLESNPTTSWTAEIIATNVSVSSVVLL
jgi:hypothetical protein